MREEGRRWQIIRVVNSKIIISKKMVNWATRKSRSYEFSKSLWNAKRDRIKTRYNVYPFLISMKA
jgi:hypothetical protein